MARIKPTTQMADLKAADIVIEAATENLRPQAEDPQGGRRHAIGADTIIASNTSSISITQLAAATGRADKFIGMHFFNPVPLMALVEMIRGLQTSDETHDESRGLARRWARRRSR
jgi:3-hydroxybutyryl-CoA dehydrogenase